MCEVWSYHGRHRNRGISFSGRNCRETAWRIFQGKSYYKYYFTIPFFWLAASIVVLVELPYCYLQRIQSDTFLIWFTYCSQKVLQKLLWLFSSYIVLSLLLLSSSSSTSTLIYLYFPYVSSKSIVHAYHFWARLAEQLELETDFLMVTISFWLPPALSSNRL